MSRADFILDLVVKAAPYRDILSGIKPEEYRTDSDIWCRRLCTQEGWRIIRTEIIEDWLDPLDPTSESYCRSSHFHLFHTARISLGYASDRSSHLRKIRGIRWGAPNPAWCYGIVTAEKCFIIELGEML